MRPPSAVLFVELTGSPIGPRLSQRALSDWQRWRVTVHVRHAPRISLVMRRSDTAQAACRAADPRREPSRSSTACCFAAGPCRIVERSGGAGAGSVNLKMRSIEHDFTDTEARSEAAPGGARGSEWSTVALGPRDQWPPSLRIILSTVLACPAPMFLAWGEDLIFQPNDAATELIGQWAASCIGEPLRTCFEPVWSRIEPLVEQALLGRGAKAIEMALDLRRGGVPEGSWWNLVFTPVHDESDAVVGVICLLRETTSSVRHKQRRHEAASRLRQALAAGDRIGAWDWDVANNSVRAERGFALFYNVDPELAERGVPMEEYLKGVHPDDRNIARERIAASIRTGGMFYCEYRLLGAGGEVQWIAAQGQPEFDDDGNCIRFPGLSFDITVNKLRDA